MVCASLVQAVNMSPSATNRKLYQSMRSILMLGCTIADYGAFDEKTLRKLKHLSSGDKTTSKHDPDGYAATFVALGNVLPIVADALSDATRRDLWSYTDAVDWRRVANTNSATSTVQYARTQPAGQAKMSVWAGAVPEVMRATAEQHGQHAKTSKQLWRDWARDCTTAKGLLRLKSASKDKKALKVWSTGESPDREWYNALTVQRLISMWAVFGSVLDSADAVEASILNLHLTRLEMLSP
jgi:hypothetical protein